MTKTISLKNDIYKHKRTDGYKKFKVRTDKKCKLKGKLIDFDELSKFKGEGGKLKAGFINEI